MAGGCRYTKEAIGLSFKLLEINPEAYTAWNYRKLAFQHNVKELSDPEAIKSAVDDELRVVSSLTHQHSCIN
jgi:geranylgeranyl transferase type-2 subunit alpha